MADERVVRALSALVLAFAILSIIETTSSQESCPYPPCVNDPPPASAGTPTTPAQTGSYPAPAQPSATYPPPVGYFPNSPPPPSGGFYAAPPPPDPILPYYPYYYRKPPRTRTEESSAAGLWRSTVVIIGFMASLGQLWFYLM